MTLAERRRHLLQLAGELRRLPLTETHSTGYPVWLVIALLADALERTEAGVFG